MGGSGACGHAAGAGSLRLGAWVTYWDYDRGMQRLATAPSLFDDVFFFSVELGSDGRPTLAQATLGQDGAPRDLKARGIRSWMTVVNDVRQAKGRTALLKDADLVHRMLADPGERAAHRRAIVDLAALHGFAGVDLDYENLRVEDRDRYSSFVRELAADLSARGLRLAVTVQPKRQESRSLGPGAADWGRLCQAADRLQIMLYNLHSARTEPGPVTAPGWFGEVLGFARGQCDVARIVPVLKVAGMDWGPKGMKELQHVDVMALLERFGASVEREAEGATPFFRYVAPDGPHTVYFEDATGILKKVTALQALGYDQVVLWSLGREDPQLLAQLQKHKESVPSARPAGSQGAWLRPPPHARPFENPFPRFVRGAIDSTLDLR